MNIKETEMEAITFVNGEQVSIVNSLPDLLKEINNYKTFWLANVMKPVYYYNQRKNVKIIVHNISAEEMLWLSGGMR